MIALRFPVPDPPLVAVEPKGALAPVLLVCPHPAAPVDLVRPFYRPDEDVQREVEARVLDWTDAGAVEALESASGALPALALRPALSRAAADLNRSWRAADAPGAAETLLGKPAVDAWSRDHLLPGALEALEAWHRRALSDLRAASSGARGLVELHSYGALGSTYDRHRGGRPVRRPASAIVHGGPWKSAFPSGLSRLVPACLDGTPWRLEAALGDALARAGLPPGPSPYPPQTPWSVSLRFLAERFFRWLARAGVLPEETASALAGAAWGAAPWGDEHAEPPASPADLPGVADLARLLGGWDHEGSALADRFHAEDGSFAAVVEMRDDLVPRAADVGRAVAEGLRRFLGA